MRKNNLFLLTSTILSMAFVSTAHAADMPPPPEEEVVLEGGWYLRGDIGVGVMSCSDYYQREVTASSGYFLTEECKDAMNIGGGIGLQVNRWLRVDVTGELRGSLVVEATDEYFDVGTSRWRNNYWNGNLRSAVFMTNVYADLGHYYGFTPFVGVGIGAAYNYLHGVRDHDPSDLGGSGMAGANGEWNFAWSLQAGLAYEVNEFLTLEAGYRYMDLGSAKSDGLQCLPAGSPACSGYGPLEIRDLHAHDIRLGMRWTFAPMTYSFGGLFGGGDGYGTGTGYGVAGAGGGYGAGTGGGGYVVSSGGGYGAGTGGGYVVSSGVDYGSSAGVGVSGDDGYRGRSLAAGYGGRRGYSASGRSGRSYVRGSGGERCEIISADGSCMPLDGGDDGQVYYKP